jgi:hypothetical protein
MASSKLEVAKAGLLASPYFSVFPCVVLQYRHRICIKFYIGNFTFFFRRIAVLDFVFAPDTISCRNAVTIPGPITAGIGIACPDWSVIHSVELESSQPER